MDTESGKGRLTNSREVRYFNYKLGVLSFLEALEVFEVVFGLGFDDLQGVHK